MSEPIATRAEMQVALRRWWAEHIGKLMIIRLDQWQRERAS